jgi:hypothetical protein
MPGNIYVCGFFYSLNSLVVSVCYEFSFGDVKFQNTYVIYCIRLIQDKFRWDGEEIMMLCTCEGNKIAPF